jgi:hypothetical protein
MKRFPNNLIGFEILLAVLVSIFCSCKNVTTKTDEAFKWDEHKPLEYLTYGLPEPMETKNAEKVVSDKWHIKFKSVAGCIVTPKLKDSIEQHNQRVSKALEVKFGKKWNERFDKEVIIELAAEKRVIGLLNKQQLIVTKRKALEKEGDELYYFISPVKDSLYHVSAEGYKPHGNTVEWVSFYRYDVNLKTLEVKLLNDSIIKKWQQ